MTSLELKDTELSPLSYIQHFKDKLEGSMATRNTGKTKLGMSLSLHVMRFLDIYTKNNALSTAEILSTMRKEDAITKESEEIFDSVVSEFLADGIDLITNFNLYYWMDMILEAIQEEWDSNEWKDGNDIKWFVIRYLLLLDTYSGGDDSGKCNFYVIQFFSTVFDKVYAKFGEEYKFESICDIIDVGYGKIDMGVSI